MWRGIVGKGFTREQFDNYVQTVKFGSWRPSFVVVHNTSAPSRAQYAGWQKRPGWTGEQWMRNLEGYYRDQQHWKAGPHLFVADDKIYVFTPLNVPGTHSPSWNGRSIGVETVGEFEREPFDGGVKDNLIHALGTLHELFGFDPADYKIGARGLHFHKEDPGTTHKTCPGRHIVKAELVNAVHAAMGKSTDEHPKERPADPMPQVERGTRVANYMPWILEDEGGFAQKATEPGGAVNKGVSMETFRAWRHAHNSPMPTIEDLRHITDNECALIYDAMYYRAIRGPELPLGPDYCVFDSAINDGVGGATRIMQRTLHVADDGVLGPITLNAVKKTNPTNFIVEFCDERLKYKKTRSGWAKNGPGWTNRINRVRERSLNLLKGDK